MQMLLGPKRYMPPADMRLPSEVSTVPVLATCHPRMVHTKALYSSSQTALLAYCRHISYYGRLW